MNDNRGVLVVSADTVIKGGIPAALQDVLAQHTASPTGGPANISAVRARFPEAISGFSYVDFQKVDWPAVKARWAAEAKAAAAAKSGAATTNNPGDSLNSIDPTVFSRHLHSLQGASWKDAKGIHFDEWIN